MENKKRVRLTTVDNPYDPFEQFDQWFVFDTLKGYHTCERLASIAQTSNQFSDSENDEEVERAMDILIAQGSFGQEGELVEFKKVYEK